MRIRPDVDLPSTLAPATARSAQGRDFADLLALANDSASVPGGKVDLPDGRPPAELWGTFGRGALPGGYGDPPDAADFADLPVGAGSPASPLNPSGMTTDAAFTVPGYTGRGTPIPPGFYNLAYYQQYLAEGGTPLDGFPALEGDATLTATYGKFGDGGTRATSFAPVADPTDGTDAPETPDAGAPAPCDGMQAGEASTPPAAAAAPPEPNATTVVAASPSEATAPTVSAPAVTEAATVARSASATATPTSTTDAGAGPDALALGATSDVTSEQTANAENLRAAIRAELTALFGDLLARV